MDSVMPTKKGICYICGREGYTESHHIFHGTANRRIAEKYGLKVWLCPECHRTGKYSVHKCRATDIALQKDGQAVFEDRYIKDYPYKNHAKNAAREAFREAFGRSYLEDDC